mmetsp:Transcript_55118/g.120052  ORF Transcript_55118/g.120052 Transcript_55118/m.120052 type:complete len:104 (-) Transcript_55118:405-716(-)
MHLRFPEITEDRLFAGRPSQGTELASSGNGPGCLEPLVVALNPAMLELHNGDFSVLVRSFECCKPVCVTRATGDFVWKWDTEPDRPGVFGFPLPNTVPLLPQP